jgi:phospholipase A1
MLYNLLNKKNIFCVLLFFVVFLVQEIFSIEKDTFKYLNAISEYKYNYFLFYEEPTKFQVSLKCKLFVPIKDVETDGLYFAFTQLSLWDMWGWKQSSPFIESNYSPEIFYKFGLKKYSWLIEYLQIGVLHESNGVGGSETKNSRSWDRIYFETKLPIKIGIVNNYFILRLWTAQHLEDNTDILEYLGLGEFIFETSVFEKFFESKLHLTIKKGTSTDWTKGSIQIDYIFGPFYFIQFNHIFVPSVFVQLWHGYGETLLNYNQSYTRLRAGIKLGIGD